jgi:plastocyanin
MTRVVLLLALLAVWPGAAAAGSVTGQVVFKGDVPPLPPIEVAKDHAACGERIPSEALVVTARSRGVRYAVAFVEGVAKGPAAEPAEVALENRRCRFVPHVLAARVGSELAVVNEDPVLHNLRAWLEGRPVFNVVQPTQGQVSKRTIKKAGVIALSCDTHVHMSGYLAAFDHPYFAVTDSDGAFTIRDVPAGAYRLRVWHEGWTVVRRDEHGRRVYDAPQVHVQEIVVPEQGSVSASFELSQQP